MSHKFNKFYYATNFISAAQRKVRQFRRKSWTSLIKIVYSILRKWNKKGICMHWWLNTVCNHFFFPFLEPWKISEYELKITFDLKFINFHIFLTLRKVYDLTLKIYIFKWLFKKISSNCNFLFVMIILENIINALPSSICMHWSMKTLH